MTEILDSKEACVFFVTSSGIIMTLLIVGTQLSLITHNEHLSHVNLNQNHHISLFQCQFAPLECVLVLMCPVGICRDRDVVFGYIKRSPASCGRTEISEGWQVQVCLSVRMYIYSQDQKQVLFLLPVFQPVQILWCHTCETEHFIITYSQS